LANDNEGKTITVELPENRGTIIFSKIKALGVVNIKGYVTDDRGIKSETPFLTMKTIETLFPNSHFQ
jgi:16S rRNA C967 or C1407 C5-methylase (RsmB/RsmF family)